MSIVMWKVLETKVASDEEDVLYRRLEARLERLARESAVPIGAHWGSPPQDEPANRSETVLVVPPSEPDMVLLSPPAEPEVVLHSPPSDPEVVVLSPPADAEIELVAEEHEPARDTVDEPVVSVEERPSRVIPERALVNLQPRPAGPERELGPRVTRAVARSRTAVGPAPLKAVAVRPVEERLSPAARRTTVRSTPSS